MLYHEREIGPMKKGTAQLLAIAECSDNSSGLQYGHYFTIFKAMLR